jgi:hypothetical protein
MKTLLTIFTLVFTVMFSSTSFAEWTKVGTTGGGISTWYVDFTSIRKHNGYVYYWDLESSLKPYKSGELSSKTYKQGDCKIFRFKNLTYHFHLEPMGEGTGVVQKPKGNEGNWKYPPPKSMTGLILKSVCSR